MGVSIVERLEDWYYSFVDSLEAAGIPIGRYFVDPLESRGIPSMWVFFLLVLLLVGGIAWMIGGMLAPSQKAIFVTDPNGEPIAGATIKVRVGDQVLELVTDEEGKVIVEGDYEIVGVEKDGYILEYAEEDSLILAPEPKSLKITVRDERGRKVEADITVKVDGDVVYEERASSLSLCFFVDEVKDCIVVREDSTIEVSASKKGYLEDSKRIKYSRMDETERVTLTLTKEMVNEEARVELRVSYEDGSPFTGKVYFKLEGGVRDLTVYVKEGYATTTLPKGVYTLKADAYTEKGYTPVLINPSRVEVVRDKESLHLTARMPKEEVKVTTFLILNENDGPVEGALISLKDLDRTLKTDKKGKALISLDPGVCFTFSVSAEGYKQYEGRACSGETVKVMLEKEIDKGIVDVTVYHISGDPVAGAMVTIITPDGTIVSEGKSTDNEGNAVFVLPVGEYVAVAEYGGVTATSDTFTVEKDKVTKVDIELVPSKGVIRVKVVQEGLPLLANVKLLRGSRVTEESSTDAEGMVEFEVPAMVPLYMVVEYEEWKYYSGRIVVPNNSRVEVVMDISEYETDLVVLEGEKEVGSLEFGKEYTVRAVIRAEDDVDFYVLTEGVTLEGVESPLPYEGNQITIDEPVALVVEARMNIPDYMPARFVEIVLGGESYVFPIEREGTYCNEYVCYSFELGKEYLLKGEIYPVSGRVIKNEGVHLTGAFLLLLVRQGENETEIWRDALQDDLLVESYIAPEVVGPLDLVLAIEVDGERLMEEVVGTWPVYYGDMPEIGLTIKSSFPDVVENTIMKEVRFWAEIELTPEVVSDTTVIVRCEDGTELFREDYTVYEPQKLVAEVDVDSVTCSPVIIEADSQWMTKGSLSLTAKRVFKEPNWEDWVSIDFGVTNMYFPIPRNVPHTLEYEVEASASQVEVVGAETDGDLLILTLEWTDPNVAKEDVLSIRIEAFYEGETVGELEETVNLKLTDNPLTRCVKVIPSFSEYDGQNIRYRVRVERSLEKGCDAFEGVSFNVAVTGAEADVDSVSVGDVFYVDYRADPEFPIEVDFTLTLSSDVGTIERRVTYSWSITELCEIELEQATFDVVTREFTLEYSVGNDRCNGSEDVIVHMYPYEGTITISATTDTAVTTLERVGYQSFLYPTATLGDEWVDVTLLTDKVECSVVDLKGPFVKVQHNVDPGIRVNYSVYTGECYVYESTYSSGIYRIICEGVNVVEVEANLYINDEVVMCTGGNVQLDDVERGEVALRDITGNAILDVNFYPFEVVVDPDAWILREEWIREEVRKYMETGEWTLCTQKICTLDIFAKTLATFINELETRYTLTREEAISYLPFLTENGYIYVLLSGEEGAIEPTRIKGERMYHNAGMYIKITGLEGDVNKTCFKLSTDVQAEEYYLYRYDLLLEKVDKEECETDQGGNNEAAGFLKNAYVINMMRALYRDNQDVINNVEDFIPHITPSETCSGLYAVCLTVNETATSENLKLEGWARIKVWPFQVKTDYDLGDYDQYTLCEEGTNEKNCISFVPITLQCTDTQGSTIQLNVQPVSIDDGGFEISVSTDSKKVTAVYNGAFQSCESAETSPPTDDQGSGDSGSGSGGGQGGGSGGTGTDLVTVDDVTIMFKTDGTVELHLTLNDCDSTTDKACFTEGEEVTVTLTDGKEWHQDLYLTEIIKITDSPPTFVPKHVYFSKGTKILELPISNDIHEFKVECPTNVQGDLAICPISTYRYISYTVTSEVPLSDCTVDSTPLTVENGSANVTVKVDTTPATCSVTFTLDYNSEEKNTVTTAITFSSGVGPQ